MSKYSRWKVLVEYASGEEQASVRERDGQGRGRDRRGLTAPSWMAFGPEAAFALSDCPVATALPGSEL